MSEKTGKKRFIAGAVCPSCHELDRIIMYKEGADEYRECVACGLKEKMFFKQHIRELDTRVNLSDSEKEAETQVLQFPPKE